MRICHVITRLIVGGAQENTLLTCRELHSRGHQVVLLTGPETGPEGSMLEQAEADGYQVTVVRGMRRAVSSWGDWQAFCRLREVLSQLRPDVVHTHSSKAGILGRLAAVRARVPTIVHTIHGISFNRTQPGAMRWFYRALERRAARKTDALITVADAMIEQSVQAGIAPPEKFTTIRSGVETDRFVPDPRVRAEVRSAWNATDDNLVVGTVARLFANKGYEDLLRALPRVVRGCPKARFVWVGDGANRDRYVRQVERLGLRDRLHLTGLVSPEEVPRLMNGFDVLVHASRWEGLPRTVVQALLMEVPVVSYDNDGAPEVVEQDHTGELVPFGDTSELAEGVIRLVSSPERRQQLGAEGRRRCLEEFDHHRMVDQIEALYRRLRYRE